MSNFAGILDLLDEGTVRDASHISASEASNHQGSEQKAGDKTNVINPYAQSDIITQQPLIQPVVEHHLVEQEPGVPFDVQLFAEEIREKSEKDNRLRQHYSNTISGYSVAHDCIGATVLKIMNYPVKSFAHKWLPIVMRASLGNAVHDCIQKNSNQFTEQEKSIKVPSIRCSVRLDCLIGSNILVEIKSCTYTDYKKIIKNQTPRIEDFYQVMMYKYLLEHHLKEAQAQTQLRTPPPGLSEYNIDTLQLIYVAHDICASDAESFSQCLKMATELKKLLNSRRNKFFFITTITLKTSDFDPKPYTDYVINKIKRINWYIDNNKIPKLDDEFVDAKKCFFCLYSDQCPIKNG